MGKYYVAGIPFDSENSLKHYGVKNMEWGKHKFGIDADDRYIKWLKNAGANVGKFVGQTAQNIGKGVNSAARTVGTAVNKGANFVTGNQNQQKYETANRMSQYSRNPAQSAQRAQQSYNQAQSKTLPGIASSAANKAGQVVSKAAQDVAQNAGRVANGVANVALWPATTQDVQNAANWVGDRARDVGNAVSGVAQNVGDFFSNKDEKEAAERANRAAKAQEMIAIGRSGYVLPTPDGGLDQYIGSLRDAMNVNAADRNAERAQAAYDNHPLTKLQNTVGDAKNAVSKAANDAANGAKGFINSAGKWVSNTAGNVRDAAAETVADIGNRKDVHDAVNAIGDAAQNVGNWVGDRARDVGQAAEQARSGIGGLFDKVGNAVGGAANAVGNWAGNAAKDVGNAVGDAAQNVGNWAGQAVQDVGGAVQNAGDWVGDRARDVGQAVANVPQNVANWYTGQPHADHSNMLRTVQDDKMATANRMMDLGTNMIGQSFDAEPPWGMSPDSSAYAQKAKDDSKGMFNAGLDVRNAGYDKMREAYAMNSPIHDADERYKSAPRQVLNSAGDWIGDRASDVSGAVSGAANAVGDWTRNAAENVGDWARDAARNTARNFSDAAGNIGNWAGQAAQNVGNFVSEMANPHYQLNAQQLTDNYRQYLNEHPENPQSPQHADWLKEQVKNDPQLRAYYEQYMKHSALNDKPDGVSDAFWEKFTADGGTREEYDRDWR